MTEAQLEAAADGKPWTAFRALYPGTDPKHLRRIWDRVKSRNTRRRMGVRMREEYTPPPELLRDLRVMINPMIREKYNMTNQKICAIRKAVDIPSPTHLYSHCNNPPKRAAGKPRAAKRAPGQSMVFDQFAHRDWFFRDTSLVGQAADYLRRFGPVVRCDDKGRYSGNGTHWRRGASILMADEIIERAEANGFDARAWARLAA